VVRNLECQTGRLSFDRGKMPYEDFDLKSCSCRDVILDSFTFNVSLKIILSIVF